MSHYVTKIYYIIIIIIQLRQLMPTSWNASSRGLRTSVLIVSCFFPEVHYCYSLALEELNLHTLRIRRHRLDALFLTQVYFGLKFCPSVLEIVGLRVPARYVRDFALFNVCTSCKNCPSARCASAANVVCKDVDVFGTRKVLLNRIL
jgi:hypothetical protein